MSLIAAPIDVELVEVSNEGVVSARRRGILRIQVDPLVLNRLELCQIVEVCSAFASIATEEEDTVFEGQTVGT